jgi:hypothetical protein
MLKRLLSRLVKVGHSPSMIAEGAREQALDKLHEHGIDAHFYLPAAGCQERELANALRLLGARGYIMNDAKGSIVGRVAKARLTTAERAEELRTRFFLVPRDEDGQKVGR